MKEKLHSDTECGQDDRALWFAFKKGDRDAFETIYRTYIAHLISYGFKITGEKPVIQDCIQDLFMELWDHREGLGEVRVIKHYLLKSLRYKIVRSKRESHTEDLEVVSYQIEEDPFENRLLEEEVGVQQSKKLHAALAKLPKRQKEAIHLRYFEEMSNKEVADLMGVNYQSACKFIYTGIKNLRDLLLFLVFITCKLLTH